MPNVGTITGSMYLDPSAYIAGLNTAAGATQSFQQGVSSISFAGFNRGIFATTTLLYGLERIMSNMSKGMEEYSNMLGRIGTVADLTAASVSALADSMKQISVYQGVSRTDVMGGMYTAAQAGYQTPAEMRAMASSGARLSRASGKEIDVRKAVDLQSGIRQALGIGMGAVSSNKLNDMLLKGRDIGRWELDQMAHALGIPLTVWGNQFAGKESGEETLRQLMAVMSVASLAGVSPNMTATGTRRIVEKTVQLASAGKRADPLRNALRGAGFGGEEPILDALNQGGMKYLNTLMNVTGGGQTSELTRLGYGSRDLLVLTSALRGKGEKLNQAYEELSYGNTAGTTERYGEKMRKTYDYSRDQLRAQWEITSQQFMQATIPLIGRFTDMLMALNTAAQSIPDSVKSFMLLMGAMAAMRLALNFAGFRSTTSGGMGVGGGIGGRRTGLGGHYAPGNPYANVPAMRLFSSDMARADYFSGISGAQTKSMFTGQGPFFGPSTFKSGKTRPFFGGNYSVFSSGPMSGTPSSGPMSGTPSSRMRFGTPSSGPMSGTPFSGMFFGTPSSGPMSGTPSSGNIGAYTPSSVKIPKALSSNLPFYTPSSNLPFYTPSSYRPLASGNIGAYLPSSGPMSGTPSSGPMSGTPSSRMRFGTPSSGPMSGTPFSGPMSGTPSSLAPQGYSLIGKPSQWQGFRGGLRYIASELGNDVSSSFANVRRGPSALGNTIPAITSFGSAIGQVLGPLVRFGVILGTVGKVLEGWNYKVSGGPEKEGGLIRSKEGGRAPSLLDTVGHGWMMGGNYARHGGKNIGAIQNDWAEANGYTLDENYTPDAKRSAVDTIGRHSSLLAYGMYRWQKHKLGGAPMGLDGYRKQTANDAMGILRDRNMTPKTVQKFQKIGVDFQNFDTVKPYMSQYLTEQMGQGAPKDWNAWFQTDMKANVQLLEDAMKFYADVIAKNAKLTQAAAEGKSWSEPWGASVSWMTTDAVARQRILSDKQWDIYSGADYSGRGNGGLNWNAGGKDYKAMYAAELGNLDKQFGGFTDQSYSANARSAIAKQRGVWDKKAAVVGAKFGGFGEDQGLEYMLGQGDADFAKMQKLRKLLPHMPNIGTMPEEEARKLFMQYTNRDDMTDVYAKANFDNFRNTDMSKFVGVEQLRPPVQYAQATQFGSAEAYNQLLQRDDPGEKMNLAIDKFAKYMDDMVVTKEQTETELQSVIKAAKKFFEQDGAERIGFNLEAMAGELADG